MNILLISDAHRIGGAEHYLFLLAKGLKQSGHQVELVCPIKEIWSNLARDFIESGMAVHRVKITSRADFGQLYFLSFINFPQILRLKKILRQLAPDIIHVNTANIENGQSLILGAHFAGLKNIVTTVHTANHIPYCLKNIKIGIIDRLRYHMARNVLSKVRKVISISRKTATGLVHRYNLAENKFEIIYNGVKTDDFIKTSERTKAWLNENKIKGDLPIVLCVANLFKEKGLDYFLTALKQLKDQEPRFLCLIVGEGSFQKTLDDYTRDNDLSKHVRFLGKRNDVNEIMKASDMFVLPSLSEGFPFVILEAMAAGLPCITTNVGGIPEMLIHNEEGFLVEPKNPSAIAQSLKQILLDKKLAERIGTKARARVERDFSLSNMIANTIEVYKGVLKKSCGE